ncbi:MAG: hypothetical protein P1P85_00625 [Patescibacteria group bacterium]|nr:hypothetical protein [Patescibacteria group bacterium]
MNETPPIKSEQRNAENENNDKENLDNLDISKIVEKIINEEEVSEKEEMVLREKIEDVIVKKELEEKWTSKESEMLVSYLKGVEQGQFKDGNLMRMEIDFDLENVKFNRLSENGKKAKIEERQEYFREKLNEQEIHNQEITAENIAKNYKELEKKLKDQIVQETEAYVNLTSLQETESLFNENGKERMQKAIESLKKSNQIALNLERLEYYRLACDNDNLKFLIEEHHIEKDYTIRMLEEALKAYDKVLQLLEKEEEALSPEEKGILTELFKKIKDNPKMTIIALLAILAGLGLVMYGPGLLAAMSTILAEKGGEEIAKTIAEKVIEESGKEAEKKVVLAGAGAFVGGVGLLGAICTLFDEEKRDKFVTFLCGTGKVYDYAWWGSSHKYDREIK